MKIRDGAIATILLLLPWGAASAQLGFIDNVFKDAQDIGVSYVFGSMIGHDDLLTDTNGGSDYGLRGLGFEVTLDLGDVYVQRPRRCRTTSKMTYTKTEKKTTYSAAADSAERVDSTITEVVTKSETAVPIEGQPDMPDPEADPCEEQWSIGGELAFGYTHTTGYRGKQFDIRGSLQELPTVNLYFTTALGWVMDPYLGVRAGLVQLQNFRGYVDGNPITASGSTYEVGLVPGLAFGAPGGSWSVFIELAWLYRKFDGIDWTPKVGTVPSILQTEFDFRTRTLSVGAQYNFKRK